MESYTSWRMDRKSDNKYQSLINHIRYFKWHFAMESLAHDPWLDRATKWRFLLHMFKTKHRNTVWIRIYIYIQMTWSVWPVVYCLLVFHTHMIHPYKSHVCGSHLHIADPRYPKSVWVQSWERCRGKLGEVFLGWHMYISICILLDMYAVCR